MSIFVFILFGARSLIFASKGSLYISVEAQLD